MAIELAIDTMGGDYGVKVTIPAALKFLSETNDVKLTLVGIESTIYDALGSELSKYKDKIKIIHATQIVAMDESPPSALRTKKDSSMRVALDLLKHKQVDAVISAGNTGALMAIAKYVLGTMPGIDRPAIAKLMPTMKSEVCMLDLGANVTTTAQQLYQFAILGSQLMRGITGKENPSIGLLNVGSEDIKGHETIKKAAEIIRESDLNFYGNVEGNDPFKGIVDVVVTDGFTGNITLKTIEGVAKMIGYYIKDEFNKNLLTKFIGILSYPILKKFKMRLDPNKYNGAILLGLNGLVVKSHGSAQMLGFHSAIKQAYHEVNVDVISMITKYLEKNQFH